MGMGQFSDTRLYPIPTLTLPLKGREFVGDCNESLIVLESCAAKHK
jgi:hypothetical protein